MDQPYECYICSNSLEWGQMVAATDRGVDFTIAYDTVNVLRDNVWPETIAQGCGGVESPIFDRMAAERFGRED